MLYSKNENNFNILEKLLLKITDVNIISDLLITTILNMRLTTSYDAIKLLLKYGADVNYIKDSWTPLICSCFHSKNNIETIQILIENGANVNSKSNTGRTAFMYLVRDVSSLDDLEVIKLLIRKKSQINCQDKSGQTPLMACLEWSSNIFIRYDLVKILLDNKANIYMKNNYNENILDIIEKKKNSDIFMKNNFNENTLNIIEMEKNSDVYSLIFYYKNLINDTYCEFDINFIYKN